MHFLILGVKWGFCAITLVSDMLEGQVNQGLYQHGRSSSLQKKFEPKFWPIGLASRASQSWSKIQKHPHFASSSQAKPSPKSKNFLIEARRLAASVEGLNRSLAIGAGEL